jgi:hypothetical protein
VINATVEANVEERDQARQERPPFNIMVVESEDEAFASTSWPALKVMHVAPNVQLSIKLPFDPVPLNLTYDPEAASAFALMLVAVACKTLRSPSI